MPLETGRQVTGGGRGEPLPVLVGALMRRHWIAITPQSSLYEAERLMRLARLRQIPVEEEAILIGLVAYRDVLRASLDRLTMSGAAASVAAGAPVATIMDAHPPTVGPDDPIALAAQRMLDQRIPCIPVVETRDATERRMVGQLEESHLLRRAYLVDAVATGAG